MAVILYDLSAVAEAIVALPANSTTEAVAEVLRAQGGRYEADIVPTILPNVDDLWTMLDALSRGGCPLHAD